MLQVGNRGDQPLLRLLQRWSTNITVESPMQQSRRASLIEAVTNTVVGYALAVSMRVAVCPLFWLQVDVIENLGLGLIFTAVSVVRGYAMRRFFECWRF